MSDWLLGSVYWLSPFLHGECKYDLTGFMQNVYPV